MTLHAARAALGAYDPQDPREKTFRGRMLQLLENDRALSRGHFEPGHVTASAFVLAPDGGAVLLVFHKKLRIWVQPGGHIEPGDSDLEQAARREVMEEVGVELEPAPAAVFDLDIHAIPPRKDEPAHEHFDVRFCLRARALRYAANDEVIDARWVPLDSVEQLSTDESVLRAVRKLRS